MLSKMLTNLHAQILVLSYMAPNHGRIIQASYDGEGLTLQYPPLWSFGNKDTTLVELFVGYSFAQPVGLVSQTL